MSKKYTVRCKALDNEGRGEVVFNNSKFAVAGVLPGEKCTIELTYGKKETGARLCEVLEASRERVEPPCKAYASCGGCSLMHMDYSAELKFKQQKIEKLFSPYKTEILPIIGMDAPLNYRNKIYAAFDIKRDGKHHEIIAGMYEENTRRVTKVKNCLIQNKTANHIIKSIIDVMNMTHTFPYNAETGNGTLRHAYIRVSQKTGKVMLVLVTGTPEFRTKKFFVQELTAKHPEIETIIHNVNTKKTGMVLGDRSTVLFGDGCITDVLAGLTFRITEKTFFQVNPVQTEKLYKAAIEMAELSDENTVLDAYCGIGTITLAAARHAKTVTGVELNPDSVKAAKLNAKQNGIENAEFITVDAAEYLPDKKFDTVFLDPPRQGADAKFIDALKAASPKKIVYVSCNPETLIRDVKMLIDAGYRVKKVQPVDMFPRSGHVESVCLLSRVSNRKPDAQIKLTLDMEDYYRIKDAKGGESDE